MCECGSAARRSTAGRLRGEHSAWEPRLRYIVLSTLLSHTYGYLCTISSSVSPM